MVIIPIPMQVRQQPQSTAIPTANLAVIFVNLLAWLLVPTYAWQVGPGTGILSLVTYAFVHAGFWHLLFNMWALWVFGNAVNRRIGNAYYLMTYFGAVLFVGLVAKLLLSGYLVGASGGVFAVMAVALFLMPSARVETHYFAAFPWTVLIGLFRWPKYPLFWVIRWGSETVPMILLVAFFIILEFVALFLSVLFWNLNWTSFVHLLGFGCGIAAVLLMPPKVTLNRRFAAY